MDTSHRNQTTDQLIESANTRAFQLRGSLRGDLRLTVAADLDRLVAEINRRTGLTTTRSDYR